MGVPEDIAKYYRQLNQSMVKLTDEDLVDESSDRHVLLDSDGTLNPNLPVDLKNLSEGMNLSEVYKKDRTERPTKMNELLDSGYTLYRERGIAQGGATSCGISTLNLRELFDRHTNLVMYADDGEREL